MTASPCATSSTSTVADAAVQGSVASVLHAITGLAIPQAGYTVRAANPNCHSVGTTTSKVADIVSYLLQSSLRQSSLPMYRRAWGLYT